MNYKVVRNAAGDLICFGPNSNQYDPGVVAGATLTIEVNAPTPALATRQASARAATKAEAQRRILAVIPQWKQANLTARGVELNTKVISGGTLTIAEQAELAAGFALWSKAKAIRTSSDLIELDIAASTNLDTFDIVNSTRWPVL